MDKYGYPTDDELDKIEAWDIVEDGSLALVEYIRERWQYADCGYFKVSGKRVKKVELHTGGWSGNEDIIRFLKRQNMFWIMFWRKSERGGHYYFKGRMQ